MLIIHSIGQGVETDVESGETVANTWLRLSDGSRSAIVNVPADVAEEIALFVAGDMGEITPSEDEPEDAAPPEAPPRRARVSTLPSPVRRTNGVFDNSDDVGSI